MLGRPSFAHAHRPVRHVVARPYRVVRGRSAVISPVVTPLDLIWNGWRMRYIEHAGATAAAQRAPRAACSPRSSTAGLPDEETYIVHRGERTFALLNAFPYTTGHLMVLPYREIAELEELDADEAAELWATVTDAVVAREGGVPARAGSTSGINLGRAGRRQHQRAPPRPRACRAGPATATS